MIMLIVTGRGSKPFLSDEDNENWPRLKLFKE